MMHSTRFIPVLSSLGLLLVTTLACSSSSDRISLDEGFTFLKLQEHRFLVKFEGDGISIENAKRNLLFHSSRLTMDDGALYFSMENLESATHVEREYIHRTIEDPPLLDPTHPEAPPPGYTTNDQHTTSISIHNRVGVVAIITTFREKPDDRSVMDASEVLEQIAETQRRGSG